MKQQERWRLLFAPGTPGGGMSATAGGLVFLGNSAYDAETGAKLWEEPLLGDRPVSWISYMLDGKQYLSILARSSPNNRLFTFTVDAAGQCLRCRLRRRSVDLGVLRYVFPPIAGFSYE